MTRSYPVKFQETLTMIRQISRENITSMAVILRHSKRFYPETPKEEPFMLLTPEGQDIACLMGQSLEKNQKPLLFSSSFGRCIETAYLIGKGYSQIHKVFSRHNQGKRIFSPFYVKEIETVGKLMKKMGLHQFLRAWFNGNLDPQFMEDPQKSADLVCAQMIQVLDQVAAGEIGICVSHDWNIFLLKEFKLGMPHEIYGDIGYLEGVAVFRIKGELLIQGLGKECVPLKISETAFHSLT